MSDSAPESNADHRDRSIKLAVVTSLLSKSGTIILRLVSIPIAIRILGLDLFGVYTAITMAVGLIDMLHIGIGVLSNGARNQEFTLEHTRSTIQHRALRYLSRDG